MAYRMTPARRAALRKAQIASARKRRKGFRGKVKTRARTARPKARANITLHGARVRKESARKQKHIRKRYTGPGGLARQHEDRKRSKGAFSHSMRGRKIGPKERKVNRVAAGVLMAHPGYAATVLGSRARGAHHARKARKRK
jgi:hypothetical protein